MLVLVTILVTLAKCLTESNLRKEWLTVQEEWLTVQGDTVHVMAKVRGGNQAATLYQQSESRESAEMPMGYNASRPVMWPTSSSKAHLLKASIIFPNIVPAGDQLSKQTAMANTSHTNHKHHLLTRHLSISWFLLVENTELVHSEHYSVLKCITHNPLWACFLWANPLLGMEELGE